MAKVKNDDFYIAFTASDFRNVEPQIKADLARIAMEATLDYLASRKAETSYVKIVSADNSKQLVINDVSGMYEDKKLKSSTYLGKVSISIDVEIVPNT